MLSTRVRGFIVLVRHQSLYIFQYYAHFGAAATIENNAAPLIPIVNATMEVAQQSDLGKTIKEGIEKLSESTPVFMRALDELKSLHPFIGGELIQRCAPLPLARN